MQKATVWSISIIISLLLGNTSTQGGEINGNQLDNAASVLYKELREDATSLEGINLISQLDKDINAMVLSNRDNLSSEWVSRLVVTYMGRYQDSLAYAASGGASIWRLEDISHVLDSLTSDISKICVLFYWYNQMGVRRNIKQDDRIEIYRYFEKKYLDESEEQVKAEYFEVMCDHVAMDLKIIEGMTDNPSEPSDAVVAKREFAEECSGNLLRTARDYLMECPESSLNGFAPISRYIQGLCLLGRHDYIFRDKVVNAYLEALKNGNISQGDKECILQEILKHIHEPSESAIAILRGFLRSVNPSVPKYGDFVPANIITDVEMSNYESFVEDISGRSIQKSFSPNAEATKEEKIRLICNKQRELYEKAKALNGKSVILQAEKDVEVLLLLADSMGIVGEKIDCLEGIMFSYSNIYQKSLGNSITGHVWAIDEITGLFEAMESDVGKGLVLQTLFDCSRLGKEDMDEYYIFLMRKYAKERSPFLKGMIFRLICHAISQGNNANTVSLKDSLSSVQTKSIAPSRSKIALDLASEYLLAPEEGMNTDLDKRVFGEKSQYFFYTRGLEELLNSAKELRNDAVELYSDIIGNEKYSIGKRHQFAQHLLIRMEVLHTLDSLESIDAFLDTVRVVKGRPHLTLPYGVMTASQVASYEYDIQISKATIMGKRKEHFLNLERMKTNKQVVESGEVSSSVKFTHPRNIPRKASDLPVEIGVSIPLSLLPDLEETTITLEIWDPRFPWYRKILSQRGRDVSDSWDGLLLLDGDANNIRQYCLSSDIFMKARILWNEPSTTTESVHVIKTKVFYEEYPFVADLQVWAGSPSMDFGPGEFVRCKDTEEILGGDENLAKPYQLSRTYPGAFIALNWDDDDTRITESFKNERSSKVPFTPDYLQNGPIDGEDNLVRIQPRVFSLDSQPPHSGIVRLKFPSAGSKVMIYLGPDKEFKLPLNSQKEIIFDLSQPAIRGLMFKSFWIEGIEESTSIADVEMYLEYERDGKVVSKDQANATVIMIHAGNVIRGEDQDPGYQDVSHSALLAGYIGALRASDLSDPANYVIMQMGKNSNPTIGLLSSFTESPVTSFSEVCARDLTVIQRLTVLRNAIYLQSRAVKSSLPMTHSTMQAISIGPSPPPPPFEKVSASQWRLDQINNMRCDGFIEAVYEASNIDIWGLKSSPTSPANYNIFDFLSEHNTIHSVDGNNMGLTPGSQCGDVDQDKGIKWDTTLKSVPARSGLITPMFGN